MNSLTNKHRFLDNKLVTIVDWNIWHHCVRS